MDVYNFNQAMEQFLGESATEAVIDAINYYLLNNKDWPCEEDKLDLLLILRASRYTDSFYPHCNALRRCKVSIDLEYKEK